MEKVEERIREKLSQKLEILSPGLSLIAQKSFLRNSKGTRGFVDLLASDSHNRYVLIELKRSKAASRDAIHEIFKYIEGIKENRSLKNDEIVAYIVSTEWEELIVPFSSFVAKVSYEVVGYELEIDEELNPIAAQRVKPLQINNERFINDQHDICLYTTDENLKKGIESHLSCFSKKGIEDFVLLVLKPHKNFRKYELQATMQALNNIASKLGDKPPMTYEDLQNKMPEYRHMIYSSVQVMDNEKYWEIVEQNPVQYQEAKEYVEDCDDANLNQMLHECAVGNCDPRPFQEHYEIGNPAKLKCKILEDERWEITDVIRHGRLKENGLLTDETIIDELTGDGGTNKHVYSKDFDSRNSATFEQMTKDVETCLADNEIWRTGITKSISELSNFSRNKSEFQGRIHIFNPSNTLLSIYHAAISPTADEAKRWIPAYYVNVEGAEIKRKYFGCLVRNKNSKSLDEVIAQVYELGVIDFLLSLTWGGYQSNDIDICHMYGLEYANFMYEVKGSERTFSRFDGFKYRPCQDIDSYEGVFGFMRDNDDFVEAILALFERNTLTPDIFGQL